jgi:uncharacterized protein (TIGR03435 family)
MVKRLVTATGILAFAAGALFAQTAAAPSFEVASIKPVEMPTQAQIASGKIHAGMKIDAARVDIGLASLMDLICKAYDVKSFQVQGPSWLNNQMGTQRFDVIAKMPEGATKEQVPQMLQALLAERFKLVIHKEKKEQAVYALVVAKGGPKMKESDPLPAALPPEAGGPTAASSGSNQVSIKQTPGGMVTSDGEGTQQKMTMGADGKMHLEISRAPIGKFAEGITPLVDRPVVDMTELKGRYEITMDLSMQDLLNAAWKMGAAVPNAPAASGGSGSDAARPADAASDPSGGGIFASVQALGLKLEPRKLPIDLIVVEKVEKMPTEN